MKFNKKIQISVLAGLSVLALFGCGNDSDTSKDGKVQLSFQTWDDKQSKGMQDMIDLYEEENPNVTIDLSSTPWDQYWTAMEAATEGGNLPDVFWINNYEIEKFADGGILLDLTEQIENSDQVSMNDFPEELSNLYTVDDKVYGLPKDYDTIALWYNKELFDDAGIDYPDENWDWDDFLNAAIELTDEEEGIYGFEAPANGLQYGYWNYVFQNDGYILNEDKTKTGLNEPNTVEAIQAWVDFSVKHKVSPTVQDFDENDYGVLFESGKSAMIFQGTWLVSSMRDNEYTLENTDMTILPKGKKRASIINDLAFAGAADTKHPEEVRDFIEFLGSEEAMIAQGESGVAMPARIGLEDSFHDQFPEFNTEIYSDELEDAEMFPYSKYTSRWEEDIINGFMPAFLGEATVEELADDVAGAVEKILETEK